MSIHPRAVDSLLRPEAYPIEPDQGRDIGAGHLRGWALEYGGLYDRIAADPIFDEALQASIARHTVLTPHKLANLYLIVRYALAGHPGDLYEFGSYRGGSAVFLATVLKRLGRTTRVLAFDTFQGIPEADAVRDLHSRGDFGEALFPELQAFIAAHDLGTHLETVQGEFSATLPGVLARGGRVALAHVDCDIYAPLKYAVQSCLPAMIPGGYLVFDDPLHGSCLGAFDAVQELVIRELGLTAEQAFPHLVFRYPRI